MALTTRLHTAEDLWRMPGDEPWEIWDGELRKVPGSGGEASGIALLIGSMLLSSFRRLGFVTGADGSYLLERNPDTVVVPDVGFVRWDRLPDRKPPRTYIPVPPDLAVEVQSPSDEPAEMARKRDLYARAGVPLLWWVDPGARTVTVHRLDEPPVTLGEGETLDGGDILPGLQIQVADIFG